MTSYCDVVSQEVSSVSGVTDMPSSSAEYSSVLRRDASEVDDAAFKLRFISYTFAIARALTTLVAFDLGCLLSRSTAEMYPKFALSCVSELGRPC